jgi:hypothetical protein
MTLSNICQCDEAYSIPSPATIMVARAERDSVAFPGKVFAVGNIPIRVPSILSAALMVRSQSILA